MYFFILGIVLIIVVVIIFLNRKTFISRFNSKFNSKSNNDNNKIIFVSNDHVKSLVYDSYYFQRMNKLDLLARNAINEESYKKIYVDSLLEYTPDEKEILDKLVQTADTYTGFTHKFKNIPWKFAKTSLQIENGFPHTIGDIIILSNKFFDFENKTKITILIHEKLHIYQRLYPLETQKLICDTWDYKIIDKIENYDKSRNNPDINSFIYSRNDITVIQLYNNENPSDITDAATFSINDNKIITHNDLDLPSFATQIEHPYEVMATVVPYILMNLWNNNTNNDFINKTKEWIQNYL